MVLFQDHESKDPISISISEIPAKPKKKRCKKELMKVVSCMDGISVSPVSCEGGATAAQKGTAAQIRTYINENLKGKMNECLFRDLSFIVHSGDRNPHTNDVNPFADPDNEYDEKAEQIIQHGIANMNAVKVLDRMGLFLPKTTHCPSATTIKGKKVRGSGYSTGGCATCGGAVCEGGRWGGDGDYYELLSGGKMNTQSIRKFLDASYADKGKAPKEIEGYTRDESLSGERVSVYYNPATKDAIVIHRGSKGIHDWGNNLKMALGFNMSKTKRFQHAKDIQKAAEAKYGRDHITTLGHSLGAKIASDVGGDSKEIINLNKATGIGWDAFKPRYGQKANETNIRTTFDPVSAKGALHADLTIPSKSINLLKEHGTGVLDRVNVEVGKGYDVPVFHRKDYEKLTKKQLKTIIKALPKRYDNFKLTGAGKPALVDYIQGRCGK